MKKTILSFTILLCLTSTAIFSQTKSDFKLAKNLLAPAPKITYPVDFKDESSLKKGAKVAFRFYKKFVSSQDMQSCNFHPSCSVYALQAIEKKGMITGFLLTFDRLTRCHPLGVLHYDRHPENGLLFDPVD